MVEHAHPRCHSRLARRVLAVLLVTAASAGCAAIPTEGPVLEGRAVVVEERPDVAAPIFASPPRAGDEPDDVVRGFLAASADFQRDHETARLYLAPEASEAWDPDAGTTIYRVTGAGGVSALATPPPGSEAGMVLSADVLARIDDQGQYRRSTPGQPPLGSTFGLRQVSGQWRINSLPDGLALTPREVSETYGQLDLYFLDPERRVVVPDPVFVPILPGVPTALVRRLLAGPSAALASAVTSSVPAGTGLAVTSVVVTDGVADVGLDSLALTADPEGREQLAAQLVWTLTQLPEIASVRISADQTTIGNPDADGLQSRETYRSYDPAQLTGTIAAYVERGGSLGILSQGRFTPVPGIFGSGQVPVRRAAVSLDRSRIAGLSPGGTAVLEGRTGADDPPVTRFVGEDLAPPAWSVGPLLWVVERGANPGVWVVPAEAEPVRVSLPDLGGAEVVAARPSRDGIRIALVLDDPDVPASPLAAPAPTVAGPPVGRVIGDRFVTGVLRRGASRADLSVEGLVEVAPELAAITDLSWSSPTEVVVLASLEGAPAQPLTISVDGSVRRPLGPRAGLTSITAAPGQRPLFGGTAEGVIVALTGGRWVPAGLGTEPAYPG